MRYFSGFSFKNEESLFKSYMNNSEFTVSGFSYGGILAFEHVLNSEERVDVLQLFSPAFFKDSSDKFIRMQLFHFKKDSQNYINNFIDNSFFPNSKIEDLEFKDDKYSDLKKLLTFEWNEDDLNKIVNRGIRIEIFLGSEDKIIDSKKAHNFFKEFGTVYFIKGVGHTL